MAPAASAEVVAMLLGANVNKPKAAMQTTSIIAAAQAFYECKKPAIASFACNSGLEVAVCVIFALLAYTTANIVPGKYCRVGIRAFQTPPFPWVN